MQGKCCSATSIDDIAFMKKLEGHTSLSPLLGDERDEAVMKDMRDNNPNRIKTEKSFTAFITDRKTKLLGLKSEINAHVYHILLLMLENMESRAPLDESTEETFRQMINKNWDWFVKPKMTEKRKGPAFAMQEDSSVFTDLNDSMPISKKIGLTTADGIRGPSRSTINMLKFSGSPAFCENVGIGQSYSGIKRQASLSYNDRACKDGLRSCMLPGVQPVLQCLGCKSESTSTYLWGKYAASRAVAPVMTNDTEIVHHVPSLFDVKQPIINTTPSPLTNNGLATYVLSKYFPLLWKTFFESGDTK